MYVYIYIYIYVYIYIYIVCIIYNYIHKVHTCRWQVVSTCVAAERTVSANIMYLSSVESGILEILKFN